MMLTSQLIKCKMTKYRLTPPLKIFHPFQKKLQLQARKLQATTEHELKALENIRESALSLEQLVHELDNKLKEYKK